MLSIYEIIELEKRWESYNMKRKKNQNKKYLIFAICGVLISILLICVLVFKDNKIKAIPNNAIVKKEIEELKEKARQAKLKIENKKENTIQNEETKQEKKVEIKQENQEIGTLKFSNISTKKIYQEAVPKSVEIDLKIDKLNEDTKKSKILIKSSEKKLTIDDLKAKFNQTKQIEYALDIAKEYYNNKNYKDAIKWALIVNNINLENEDSWIIFAKSKYKINQKKDAIKVLEIYNKTKNSKAIEELLDMMRSDKL